MRFTPLNFLVALLVVEAISAAVVLPRFPKGGSGGGGRGGGSIGVSSFGSGSGRGGSGDTGHPAVSGFGGSGGSSSTRSANYFSQGGGQRLIMSQDSVFRGREYGGDVRSEVPGTRAYGSGYPYVAASILTSGVVGQPFPFGFWPLYWAGHGESYQYGGNSTVDTQRPGGDQALAQLLPAMSGNWNTTTINRTNENYWMIGDKQSATTLLSILVDNHSSSQYGCDVQNTMAVTFDSTDPATLVHFENVLQWYRASSFALAFQGYDNSCALPPLNETANLGWNGSTPLPIALQYSPPLQCINNTITAALPILDPDSDSSFPLSTGMIAVIVVGSVVGAILLGVPAFSLFKKVLCRRRQQSMLRNSPQVLIDSASDVPHTKMETSDTASDEDGSSVLSRPVYTTDAKPYTSQSPLLSPSSFTTPPPSPPAFPTPLPDSKETARSFPTPYLDKNANGSGQELTYSSQPLITDFRPFGRDRSA